MTTRALCTGTWIQKSVNLINSEDVQVLDGSCSLSGSSVYKDGLDSLTLVSDGNTHVTTQTLCTNGGGCLYDQAGAARSSANQLVNSAGACLSRKQIANSTAELIEGDFRANAFSENVAKSSGQFYIYIPSDILREVGFVTDPEPGAPQYIAYSISYTEASVGRVDPETRVIETDVLGFRWTPMYNVSLDNEDLSDTDVDPSS